MMSRPGGRPADTKKINSELFTLTYGALVSQLLRDYENAEDVNRQLDRMGYNIGVRIIEDFLARTNAARCSDMKETAEKIQSAFKMYLGVSPTITNWSVNNEEFSLIFDQNPMTEFVELPENLLQLKYCNLMCGIIRGACEMVQLEVSTYFIQDSLKGDPTTELRIKFVKKLEDAMPAGED